MSLISISYVFSVGNTIIAAQHNLNNSVIYNDYNGNIQDANIASNAAIEYTKLALNNTIRSTDILSTTVFSVSNIPTLSYSNITPYPYVKCSNTQTSGTQGGSATTGSWQTYPLNTKDFDTGSIATLTSNTISLPSGTYAVRATIVFYETDFSQARVYNSTDSSILLSGSVVEPGSTTNATDASDICGQFTISATKNIIIQYQVGAHSGTTDLGRAASYGSEVYGQIEFTKVA